MKTLIPVLQVRDVRKTLDFYLEVLGFELRFATTAERQMFQSLDAAGDHKLVYAQAARGGVEMMFQLLGATESEDSFLRGALPGNPAVSFYFHVQGVDDLCAQVRGRAEILSEPNDAWYGMREFFIRDPDGYVLGFGQPEGDPPT